MADSWQLDLLESASADADAGGMFLSLTVLDPDVVESLGAYAAGPAREQFALAALRIGVLALRQARGQLDADTLRSESQRLLGDMQRQLEQHAALVHQRLAGALQEYFDPESGRFHERVQRLIRKDGELEALLQRQVGGDDSELCRTLAQHFGQDSPLMQILAPDQSRGLLAALRATLEAQLGEQRKQVLQQFSLDNKDGALSRLVGELNDNQGQLTKSLEDKIDEVVKEFSLDVEDSALNRLVRNVDRAQRTISAEFSLDNDGSALARLKQLLETTQQAIHGNLTLDDESSSLARLKRELLTILESQTKLNHDFQEEVKVTLAKITAKREEALRSTRHGLEFEAALGEFLRQAAANKGDLLEHTGGRTGLIKNCKVGDYVLELGPETIAPGAKIAIEAKEVQGYSLAEARAECEQARKNRGAGVALFVFSRQSAPAGLEPFGNFGQDLFVLWDPDDTATDIFLKVGLAAARTLSCQADKARSAEAADFEEIEKAIREVEKRAANLEQVEKWAATIRDRAQDILEHVGKTRASLGRQAQMLDDRVDDLRQMGPGAAS